MTDLQQQLAQAKRRLSDAAAACLRNEPGAADAADQARREVDGLIERARVSASNSTQAGDERTAA